MGNDGQYWVVRLEVRRGTYTLVEEHRQWVRNGDRRKARDTAIALATERVSGSVVRVLSAKPGGVCAHD